MVETDCPFLAPQGKRGQRNRPAYVVIYRPPARRTERAGLSGSSRPTTANAERFVWLAGGRPGAAQPFSPRRYRACQMIAIARQGASVY
ncbi:MAG: TatD family hydrolase [Hymenobacter sp.]